MDIAKSIKELRESTGMSRKEFSEQLNMDELYTYLSDVKHGTESILRDLSYDDLRRVRYGL